ncbi:hypothetical protein F385_3644 [Pantoea agglomerans 299R]|jgi:uncharacterized membrane protein|nr:DUF2142 domain-containing protein [Pantoea agglomerans]ELP23392.1 hypothetical protein F385_3644 [Pantoea agglomerans 299R]
MTEKMEAYEKKGIIAYLTIIFVIGLFFVFKNTPLTGLDERFHFFRAYQISQGEMLPKEIGNEKGAWGGCVSDKALQYVWPFFVTQDQNKPASKADAAKRAKEIDASINNHNTCFNFAPSATYSPILYLPSAIGIAVTRLAGMGIDNQMYAGRLLNLFVYIGMVYLTVALIPVMRFATLFILTFPTLINLASSYSPDPVTNLVTALFIACCLRMAILKERLIWQTFVLAGLVGLLKMTNIAYLPFLMLIPAALFNSKIKWVSFVAGSMIFGCLIAAAWNMHYSWVPSQFWHSGGDAKAAMEMLISQPHAAVAFILKSIWIQTPDMFNRMFATFGGGPQAFTWTIGGPFCRGAMIFIIISTVMSLPKKQLDFGWLRLSYLPAMSLGSIVLIFAALWIGFSPLNIGIVAGVQGRYFIISLLTFMLFIVLALASSERVMNSSLAHCLRDRKILVITAVCYLALISYVSYLSVIKYLPLYL